MEKKDQERAIRLLKVEKLSSTYLSIAWIYARDVYLALKANNRWLIRIFVSANKGERVYLIVKRALDVSKDGTVGQRT